jgi:hypothetical protein
MKYEYEDLSDDQFEKLVELICQKLLGISAQGFAMGPDGGRDAKFLGKAELFPSRADPWVGTTIIQAKHTNGINLTFSHSDFFSTTSNKNTIIGKEIPRIKNLRRQKQLDHYMLFANRRLSAKAESNIRTYISEQCEIPEESIFLGGVEKLETWLKTFPDVPKQANLSPVDSPLIISPDDLSEIVEALARHKDSANEALKNCFCPKPRTSYEKKNELNDMSTDYAKFQIRRYLKETGQIKDFLAAPENDELLQKYNSVIEEFQFKIISKRRNYQSFDEVMEYLLDLLVKRDPVLGRNKRLTRIMLFYMYWSCDIGKDEEDAATD